MRFAYTNGRNLFFFRHFNNGSGNVSGYTIDAASGALKPMAGSPFTTGTYPDGVAVDPKGKFAYVANNGSDNVWAYSIDSTSGALKPVKGSPFAAERCRWMKRAIIICRRRPRRIIRHR